jgi:hypothetical protein
MTSCLSSYADGRPYRAPRSTFNPSSTAFLMPRACPTFSLDVSMDWPAFWDKVQSQLRGKSFQRGTLRTYRQVLRTFRSSTKEHKRDTPIVN